MKKSGICIAIIIFLFAGCTSSNEDPTNIELEVLRANLLEKQMMIDDLTKTIDNYVDDTKDNQSTIAELQDDLNAEKELRDRLVNGANVTYDIDESQNHYFEIVDNNIVMLTKYKDSDTGDTVQKLYWYSNNDDGRLIYTGKNVVFDVDREKNELIVCDAPNIFVLSFEGEVLNQTTFDLLDETQDSTFDGLEDKYISEDKPETTMFVTDTTLGGESDLLNGFYRIDYSDMDQITTEGISINSTDYYIDTASHKIYYSDYQDGEFKLYSYNLEIDTLTLIDNNVTKPFDLHYTNGGVYYFNEASSQEKKIEIE